MDCKANPVVLEFIGLPGAGKSTIVRAIRQRLGVPKSLDSSAETRLIDWRRVPRWDLIPQSRFEMRLLANAVLLAAPLRPVRLDRFQAVVPLASAHRRALDVIAESNPNVVLFEEWILQRVWSILAFAPRFSLVRLERLLALIAGRFRPTVIHVRIDPAAAAERIAKRVASHSRFDRISQAEREQHLEAGAGHLLHIVECAVKVGLVVHEVDANKSPDANAEQVLSRGNILDR